MLSGGGARAYAHIGAIKALRERGVPIDFVGGASMGAIVAAGVAMVPVPGLDWLTDVGVLVRLLPQISAEFGLSPAQIERLAPERRIVVALLLALAGGLLALAAAACSVWWFGRVM